MKKIILLSSGQPSVNPRLVKEANALYEAGYNVFVIYSYWTDWALESDKVLFKTIKWVPILAGGSPFNDQWLFYYTRFRLKIANFLLGKIGLHLLVAECAKSRTYSEILKAAKSFKADLYIAHNLSALPIAIKAANYHKVKCGFDAEDFHRQEVSDNIHSKEYKLAKYLEDKYLPQVDYITAASPLIAAEYKQLYPQLSPVIINNVFSSSIQNLPNFKNWEGLRLFWFSQTIGKGRGLEDVIKAIGILKKENISFTLLGNVTSVVKEYLVDLASANGLKPSQLIFLDPVVPDDIFQLASQYDVGLAIELKIPYNRDICLTNKIFTYLTSGLAIIASETQAQKQFMQAHPAAGKTYPIGEIEKLAENIRYYFENADKLQKTKEASFALGKKELNWEKESEKLIELINYLKWN